MKNKTIYRLLLSVIDIDTIIIWQMIIVHECY